MWSLYYLFHYFLLCLASVITVFRHWCLLLRFWFVIGQTLLKQWVLSSISTLVWTAGNLHAMLDHSLTQTHRRPTRRLNQTHPDDATKLETRGKIWEETADWATEVKRVWIVMWLTELQQNVNVCDIRFMLKTVTLANACQLNYVFMLGRGTPVSHLVNCNTNSMIVYFPQRPCQTSRAGTRFEKCWRMQLKTANRWTCMLKSA